MSAGWYVLAVLTFAYLGISLLRPVGDIALGFVMAMRIAAAVTGLAWLIVWAFQYVGVV